MFDQNVDHFRAMLLTPGNENLKALWDQTSDRLVAELAAQGIAISKAELIGLRSVRTFIATNGDESFLTNVKQEAEESIPRLARQREYEGLQQKLAAEDADALAALDARRPADKMRLAREKGMNLPQRHEGRGEDGASEARETSVEDLHRRVATLSGSERLKAHRELQRRGDG